MEVSSHGTEHGNLQKPRVSAKLRDAGAPGAALRSFDPNIRPAVMGSPGAVRDRVRKLAAECHVVKLSDDDAAWLGAGEAAPEQVLRSLAESGVRLAVMTRGAGGCTAIAGGELYDLQALPVTVADTIGAGDAFMAGLLFGLVRVGGDRLLVEDAPLPADRVERVLDIAAAVAAITVSRPGADPPTLEELRTVVAGV